MIPLERILYLLDRVERRTATVDETREAAALIDTHLNPALAAQLANRPLPTYPAALADLVTWQPPLRLILAADKTPELRVIPSVHRVHFLKATWFRYAAILLLIAGTATFLYLTNQPQKEITLKKPSFQQDIAPGGNRAILTLADGSTIVLDSAAIGNLASQGNTKILKLAAGSLAYQVGANNGEIAYNTISTPKGGQYQIVLPDGTKVWLNAASSVTFPTAFAKDRVITTKGEVYFEVAQDRTKPFVVKSDNVDVQVLGTSFNVNSYPDEAVVATTLINGAVRVRTDQQAQNLIPGQQVQVTREGNLMLNKNADIDKVMAWKNGFIRFEGKPLDQVMREIARWYDIEVVYQQGVPNVKLGGEMSRNVSLSGMIAGLEAIEVHVKLEGRRLLVLPK